MGQAKRILVVDDDMTCLETLAEMVKEMGYEVLTASNGAEAVKVVRTLSPDILITDIFMPEKDGIEMIKLLRHTQSKIGIIAVSGGTTLLGCDFLKIAEHLGAHAALQKPVSLENLHAAIGSVLDLR